MIGADTETHPTTSYDLAPPVVCLTLASNASHKRGEPVPRWLQDLSKDDPRVQVEVTPEGPWTAIVTGAQAISVAAVNLIRHHTSVWHRAAYDIAVLIEHAEVPFVDAIYAFEQGRIKDTAVREALMDNAVGRLQLNAKRKGHYSLINILKRRTHLELEGKTGDDRWQLNFHILHKLPLNLWPEEAVQYAVLDAWGAFHAYNAQADETFRTARGGIPFMEGDDVVDELPQTCASFAGHLRACHGMLLDPLEAAKVLGRWQTIIDEGLEAGRQAGFVRANGSKDTKVMRALVVEDLEAQGLTPARTAPSGKFPDGQIKLDEAQLALCRNPYLRKFAESASYAGAMSRWGETLQSVVPRVTYRHNVLVATGRESVAKPPFHQPPKKGGLREAFIARDGWVLVSTDYNQIELVTLAYTLEVWGLGTEMADRIRQGRDLHDEMAVALWAVMDTEPAPDMAWFKAHKKTHEKAKFYRALAKVANFGLPGGLGARSFVAYAKNSGVDIDIWTAKTIIAVYKENNPAMVEYFKLMGSMSDGASDELLDEDEDFDTNGFVLQQLVSGRVRGGCTYTSGCNTMFQGLAADGLKAASWEIMRRCYTGFASDGAPSKLAGCRPCLNIHDETIIEIPLAVLDEAAREVAHVMVTWMAKYVPTISAKAEPAAMYRWSKDADAVYDENGKLIPWTPKEAAC